MLIGLVCAAVVIALLFPETLEQLAKRLSLNHARVVFALLAFAVIVGVIVLLRTDGAIVIAQGLPEAISWFTLFDIATYIDVIGLALFLGATVRFRAVYLAVRSAAARMQQWTIRCIGALQRVSSLASRSRSRRTRPTVTRPRRGEDEDRPAPGFAFA